jgi:hypothetical protein
MLGCFPINFLVLSVVHQGVALPIMWTFLPKKGNSNTKERMALLNRFITQFGTCTIDCLLEAVVKILGQIFQKDMSAIRFQLASLLSTVKTA